MSLKVSVSAFKWGIDQTFMLTQPTATLVFSKLANGEFYCKALYFIQLGNSIDNIDRDGLNPILHGGEESSPPGRLSLSNRRWMPQMGWFFMTLFLSISERSWLGHFWDFFLKKFQKWPLQDFSNIATNKVTKNQPVWGIQRRLTYNIWQGGSIWPPHVK